MNDREPTTNELLAAIHDLLLVIHLDLQRNYDLLYANATGQQPEVVDGLVNRHSEGLVWAPPVFLPGPDEDFGPEPPADTPVEPIIELFEESDENRD